LVIEPKPLQPSIFHDWPTSLVFILNSTLIAMLGGLAHRHRLSIEKQQEQLIRANANLQEEVKLRTQELLTTNEQLQGFTYSVAHDLRQHIRGVNVNASLLLREASDHLSTDDKEVLNNLVDTSKRMAQLTN